MKASDITERIDDSYLKGRLVSLQERWSNRNTRMDDMIKLYQMDLWTGEKPENRRRVTSPRAWNVVEAARALLFTRRPVIEVPPSEIRSVSAHTASEIEKFLYGAWERMGLYHAIDDMEWWATTVGLGVIRLVYDPDAPDDELPLRVSVYDPRTVYYWSDPQRPLHDSELIVCWDRARRDIMQEWDTDLGAPDADSSHFEEWLDEEVEYVDYWATYVIEEEEEVPQEEEPEGVLTRGLRALGLRVAQMFEQTESRSEGEEKEEERQTRTVRKRVVVNAVMADGVIVKDPVIMPGYRRIPFFHWAGVRTGMTDRDACLSILYPIAGGARKNGAQGLVSAESELMSLQLMAAERHAAAALVVNDDTLDLDLSPGAVNYSSRPDLRLEWVVPPSQGPDLTATLANVAQNAEDATIPSALLGRYQAAMSGIAMTMVTNPVLMRIAMRQRERETVLQELNALVLDLVEEYAPPEGWAVWGVGRNGQEFEARLDPDAVSGYRRNRVRLSAQMPKDAPNLALALSNLVQNKMLSRRTAREEIQRAFDLSGQSPEDEEMLVLIESILFDSEDTRRAFALEALKEYDPQLAATVIELQQGLAAAGPQPPRLAQGPMGGMGPQAAPPQGMPAALNPLQAMRMQQGPQGPIPGRPPGGAQP